MNKAVDQRERCLRIVEDPEESLRYKQDLTDRIRTAMAEGDFRTRLALVSEVCFLFSAQMTYDAAKKTRALMVAMRDVHGARNEEIEAWLSGNSSTRPTFFPTT